MVARERAATILLLLLMMLAATAAATYDVTKRAFWFDEGCSMIRIIAKYPVSDFYALELPVGELISRDRVIKQGSISSNPKASLTSLVKALLTDAKQVPIYFCALHIWSSVFGSSATALRSLSIPFGVLQIPAMYWFCFELFRSKRVSLIAAGLLPFSPFWLYFAQEARAYSMWGLFILISSSLLLRAVRDNRKASWLAYSVAIVVTLYTQLLTLSLFVSHLCYTLLISRIRFTKAARYHLFVAVGSALLLAPWLALGNFSDPLKKAGGAVDYFAAQWLFNLTSLFAIFPQREIVLSTLIIAIELIAVAALFFRKNKEPRDFLVPMIVCSIGPMLVPDLLFGGTRSLVTRYLEPAILGIYVSVAALFATGIGSKRPMVRASSTGALGALMLLQIISCVAFYRSHIDLKEIEMACSGKNGKCRQIERAVAALKEMDRPVAVFTRDGQIAWIVSLMQSAPNGSQCMIADDTNNMIPPAVKQVLLCDYTAKGFDLAPVRKLYMVTEVATNSWLLRRK